jgi:signal transduction histidine kinase/DNA-binding response OmpR family regulator
MEGSDAKTVPGPARVLVVDDEPDICRILVDWLKPRGYEVETTGDAESALERLARGGIEAVLVDLHLPGRDGLELAEEARRLDGDLAILIMTGFGTMDSAIEALRHQADDYLQKPFDLQALVHALDHSLERRRLEQENRRLVGELRAANADLDRRVEQKTRTLQTLLDITRELTGTLELENVLSYIAEQARELLGARAALLHLRHGDTYPREVSTGVDPHREPRVVQAVAEIVLRVASSRRPWRADGGVSVLRSVLAVPLTREGSAIGVLVLIDRMTGEGFDDEQEALASGFATHAAVAIRNAQIYEETKRLDRLQSSFIAAISHELRTPLTSMKAPLEILNSRYGGALNEAGQQLLKICLSSAERLEDLIELILFSAESGEELDPGQFEVIGVDELVHEAVDRIEGVAAHKEVPIEVTATDATATVFGYHRGLVRVLVCLLSNAVKFSERGQRVHLRTESDGERVAIHVVDEGVGIDPDDQPLIFRRFAQLDGSLTKRHPGTGLGLSVARALVEQHGGEIRVTSRIGSGSQFSIDLPQHVADRVPVPSEGEGEGEGNDGDDVDVSAA